MIVRKTVGVSLLVAVVSCGAAITAAPALASSTHAGSGQSYSPPAKPPQTVKGGGQVVAVVPKTGAGGTAPRTPLAPAAPAPAAQVQALPVTGGANPTSPDNSILPLLAAAALSALGFGVRRRYR